MHLQKLKEPYQTKATASSTSIALLSSPYPFLGKQMSFTRCPKRQVCNLTENSALCKMVKRGIVHAQDDGASRFGLYSESGGFV